MITRARAFARSSTGRLTLAVSGLVFVIVAFIAIYFPTRAAQRAELALREEADVVAHLTATRLAPALVFGDKQEAMHAVAAAEEARNFVGARVTDATGQVVASVSVPPEAGDDTLGVSMPVEHDGAKVGTLHLVFTQATVRAEAAQQRRHVLALSAVLLLLGTLAAFVIGQAVTRPLRQLADSADRVASGDLSARAPRTVTEEGGRLVRAFNTMMDRLQQAQDALAEANLDLEARVEERTRDLRHTTRQLAIERDRAEEGSRSKSRFLATMSHEIRTPLNGILGMASLLADSPLTPTQRDCVETLTTSGDALVTIIDDILDFSKIEAGRLELERIEFDLYPLVEDVIDLVGVRVAERGLHLATEMAPGVPARLHGDPGRVRQVLLNLVGNAIKYTPFGEVLVRVATEGEAFVRFEVRDTGIGLNEEARSRLFQPFVQGDGSTTRQYGGTGLGLAISRQLVEMMGGTIGVESEPGRGSTFWFTLPAPVPAPAAPRLPAPTMQVLVVEDHRPTAAMAAALLAPAGIAATACSGAAAAIAALDDATRVAPSLLLVDDELPGADELAARAARDGVPVLWLATQGVRGRRTPQVPKPLRTTSLLRGVEQALRGAGETPDGASGTLAVPAGAEVAGPAPRLLLVEDNTVNQKVARMLLERLGWQVDVAADGRQAVEAVAREPYDLVLMDCQMPVMDGFEATREIRKRETALGLPRIPIIALTANAMRGDREACLASDMDDFVSKPIQPQVLAAALTRRAQGESPDSAPAATPDAAPAHPILDPDPIEALREVERETGMEVVKDIVGEYLSQLGPRLDAMASGLAADDLPLVAREAHSLKGASGSLGARALYHASADVERSAKAGDAEAVAAALPALTQFAARTRSIMEPEMAGAPAEG